MNYKQKYIKYKLKYKLLKAGSPESPIQIKIDEILSLDESTEDYKVAEDMLMGKDDFCMNYINYCRQGAN